MPHSSPQFVTSKDGTKIAYDVSGSGPVLIYVAGATSFRDNFSMRETAKAFSEGFTTYNYDRRGRGDSTDVKPYSIEKEVDDIEALIDAAGGKACLYGHSAGAVLVLEAALMFPEKIDKAVVYDPPFVHTKEEQTAYGNLAGSIAALLAQGKNGQAIRCFLAGIGISKFLTWLLPVLPGWKATCELAPTLAYDFELTRDFPPIERLKKIGIPVLVLTGSDSSERLRTVSPQVAAAIPG